MKSNISRISRSASWCKKDDELSAFDIFAAKVFASMLAIVTMHESGMYAFLKFNASIFVHIRLFSICGIKLYQLFFHSSQISCRVWTLIWRKFSRSSRVRVDLKT